MTRRSARTVSRQIHTLFTVGSFHGLSDRQLLDRFIAPRDATADAAFAVLIERHGPMVLGICRRLVGNAHDAEDAFQATFLVLVRQAGSIRVEGSLGRWLYGVAMRVAVRARAKARRGRAREQSGLDRVDPESRDTPAIVAAHRGDVQAIVAEELGKLPARFRSAIVLCDLEGSTHDRAAQVLGCPVGTVKSRLLRARARLRRQLIRRGLGQQDLDAVVPMIPTILPQRLLDAALKAAPVSSSGSVTLTQAAPATVLILTEGVLRTMFWTKLKLIAAALFVIGSGSLFLVSQATAQKPVEQTGAVEEATSLAGRSIARLDDIVDLEMLERAWVDGINRRDGAVIARILASDFGGVDSAGNGFTKASYLRNLAKRTRLTERIVQESLKIRLFGDSAVASSCIRLEPARMPQGLTNVYVRRAGRWQCVASQEGWPPPVVEPRPLWVNISRPRELSREVGDSQLENQLLRTVIDLRQKLYDAETAIGHLQENAKKNRAGAQPNPTAIARIHNDAADAARPWATGVRFSDTNYVLYQPYTFSQNRIVSRTLTRISPRFKCRVEVIHVKAGQTVKKGDSLLDLSGTELAAAKSNYRITKTQWEHDRTVLQRHQKLIASDEYSRRLLAASQKDESHSLLEFQVAEGKLKTLGLDTEAIKRVETEDGDRAARLTLRSPIDGTVLEVGAEVGGLYDTKKDLLLIVPPVKKAVRAGTLR